MPQGNPEKAELLLRALEGRCAGWVRLKNLHKVGQRFMRGTDMSQSPQSHQLKASEMYTW